MKKVLFFGLFFLLLTFMFPVSAQDRFATCDLCGFCMPTPPAPTILPGDWDKCRDCIYEHIDSGPDSKETLRVVTTTNLQTTPVPGRQYTMLGCIKTDLGSFTQEGAAQSLTSILLSFLFTIAGGVAFLYLLYGTFTLLTSQAASEKIDSGKRIIYGAIVGLIFTILAVFILKILASGVLKIPGFQ